MRGFSAPVQHTESNNLAALTLSNISKSFDGRPALTSGSLEIEWGEVHALLGENGAGKSTLMNVLCGIYAPDSGQISIGEKNQRANSPGTAIELGIGIVHQHFMLVENFTVTENIFLYCGEKLGYSSPEAMRALIRDNAAKVGLNVNADAVIRDISIAEKQRVEILKILIGGAQVLILDEPTSVLTDDEAEAVLMLLRKMAAEGRAVILITHKLREVLGFSDRVTIMRAGNTVVAGAVTKGLTRGDLSQAMVGDETQAVEREFWELGSPRLTVSGLGSAASDTGAGIHDISFEVRSGEVFGIAGVGGNGQPELVDALIGLGAANAGSVRLNKQDLISANIRDRRNAGMRYIPADRFKSGITANLKAYENFGSTEISSGRYGGWIWVNRAKMRRDTDKAIKARNILGCQSGTLSRLLSGGNAQKLLLARELDEEASVIIAHSPTRGLDVQACKTVHTSLLNSARSGAACVLISEDLEEILGLSTTIAVMNGGRIAGILNREDATRERIGELMLGHA